MEVNRRPLPFDVCLSAPRRVRILNDLETSSRVRHTETLPVEKRDGESQTAHLLDFFGPRRWLWKVRPWHAYYCLPVQGSALSTGLLAVGHTPDVVVSTWEISLANQAAAIARMAIKEPVAAPMSARMVDMLHTTHVHGI